jgi:metallo-beta-lactamase family protein
MRIQFCGADRTVTGSCHLLEINGLRLVLDVGLYQGPRAEARRRNTLLPDDPAKVDAVILSHGHLDHCGKLPVLTRAGYTGPIYCTAATAEVARVVLQDAAKIQAEDAEYLNQRNRAPGEPLVQPLYTTADLSTVLHQFRRVNRGQKIDLGRGVSFTFRNAGHILGSCYVLLEWTESDRPRTLLFTGDVGRYDTPIIADPEPLPGPVDYLLTESTYGNRTHAPMSDVGPQILDAVRWCVEHRSRLIVPAFALGRTQTMLWYVQRFIDQKLIPPIRMFVDSPMGVDISRVYSQFRDEYDEETRAAIGSKDLFGMSRVTFASSTQDSKAINAQSGPCVIIASSPTCEFGRVLHHLTHSIERPNDVVLFCGWTPPGTLGRRLQDGNKRLRIYDRWYDARCQVRTVDGLSAHADGDELLRFLAPTLRPDTNAYVVHGEPNEAQGFAARLLNAGVGRASVPAQETDVFDLTASGVAVHAPTARPGGGDGD